MQRIAFVRKTIVLDYANVLRIITECSNKSYDFIYEKILQSTHPKNEWIKTDDLRKHPHNYAIATQARRSKTYCIKIIKIW